VWKELGLDSEAVKAALEQGIYEEDVESDIYEARQVVVRGVPFFVITENMPYPGHRRPNLFCRFWKNPSGNGKRKIPYLPCR
jgi:predicted DsbA family dithiol-disulfide isomerase